MSLKRTGKSRTGGRFKKGETGNPNGRTKGVPNRVSRAFREAVGIAFDDMGGTTALVSWAKKNPGDFYRIAARLVPPGSAVNIGPLEGGLADQGEIVFARMAEGAITPEQASTIMQALSARARILEVDELERRVAALEAQAPAT